MSFKVNLRSVLTLIALFMFGYIHTQTWQYYNDSNVGDYIICTVETEEEDVYSLTSNRYDVDIETIIRKHSGLSGEVELEYNYSNDSLELKFFDMIYYEDNQEFVLIGGGRDFRDSKSMGDIESYFITLVLNKDLELQSENVTYMMGMGVHVTFPNASLKSNGNIIVVLNLSVFPFTGFYQNVFLELNHRGEIIKIKKEEPVESVWDNTQFWITENLEQDGYVSMGRINYSLDENFNVDTLVIDDFSPLAAGYNRGGLSTLNDSTYIFCSDNVKPIPYAIQIATMDQEFKIKDFWFLEGDYDVILGNPMDFKDDKIFFAAGYKGGVIITSRDEFNFQLIQLNKELEPQWIKIFGAIDDGKSIYPYDVTATQDGGVLVGGQVKYLADDGTWSNASEFIIKFDENGTTPTSELPTELSSLITIYPNPTTEYMTISNDQSRDLEFQIYDAAGRLILTQRMSSTDTEITIDTQSLTAGSYFLYTIRDDRQIDSYQFVKQ